GFARVERTTDRVQIGVGQHAATVVTQTAARIVEVGAWHVDVHVDAGIVVFGAGVTHQRGTTHGHAARVHSGHATVHAAMPGTAHGHRAHHVLHAQPVDGIGPGHLRLHARAWRERAARVAAAVDRLREQRVGTILPRLDDH